MNTGQWNWFEILGSEHSNTVVAVKESELLNNERRCRVPFEITGLRRRRQSQKWESATDCFDIFEAGDSLL